MIIGNVCKFANTKIRRVIPAFSVMEWLPAKGMQPLYFARLWFLHTYAY